jgi:hypothetical protein
MACSPTSVQRSIALPHFGGTYDEHRWGVLLQRWRPKGHRSTGVFPPGEVGDEPAHREFAEGLKEKKPAFEP